MLVFSLQLFLYLLVVGLLGFMLGFYFKSLVGREETTDQTLVNDAFSLDAQQANIDYSEDLNQIQGKLDRLEEISEKLTSNLDLPSTMPDDLKRINGIGKVLEEKLKNFGIRFVEDIAIWSETDVASFNRMLDFKGRIGREQWVAQAKQIVQFDRDRVPEVEKKDRSA